MQRYYLNKLKNIENKIAVSSDDEIKILTYCTLPNKQIKADLQIGLCGLQESVYLNSEEELEQYRQDKGVTLSIDGININLI